MDVAPFMTEGSCHRSMVDSRNTRKQSRPRTQHTRIYAHTHTHTCAQAAALLGVGLLYEGSCHRLMVETLLEEVGRSTQAQGSAPADHFPGRSGALPGGPAGAAGGGAAAGGVTQEREGYSLAAGMALGLVTLGVGPAAAGLADLDIVARLRWVKGSLCGA